MKTAQGELRLISYNIAGLPLKTLFEGRSAMRDAAEIGRQVRAAGYDLLAVQEDFSSYGSLRRAIQAPYHTFNKGNVPAGDGLDLFSKRPLYNIERVGWSELYGGLLHGLADEYTPKGFMHAVMQMAPGVYIDVYNLHAVAGVSGDSDIVEMTPTAACRRAGFEQLSAYIQAHSAGRAVIVLGDFNSLLSRLSDGLAEALAEPCGLTDTWTDGLCEEKIDKIFFRSGMGVELLPVEALSLARKNAKGRSLSDHSSWTATLQYTLTGEREPVAGLSKPAPMPATKKLRSIVSGLAHDAALLKKELTTSPTNI